MDRFPADLIRALKEHGIEDERVLAAFARTDRAEFVPAEGRLDAYRDVPVAIPDAQVTTQPSLIALMVEALELSRFDSVLEVGTGLGFQAAILSRLCREVDSIERFRDLRDAASRNLARTGIQNVRLHLGDGSLGLPERAPFDAIVCSAAAPEVPPAFARQLREGGRLVIPIGPGGDERVLQYRKSSGRLVFERELIGAHFVRLVGEGVRPAVPLLRKVG